MTMDANALDSVTTAEEHRLFCGNRRTKARGSIEERKQSMNTMQITLALPVPGRLVGTKRAAGKK